MLIFAEKTNRIVVMKQRLFTLVSTFFLSIIASAQGLYSESLAVTKLTGCWTDGVFKTEYSNTISNGGTESYVMSHIYKYKNISMIHTAKFEYKDVTYYVWMIDYLMNSSVVKDGAPMTNYLVLTEAQNNRLKNVSTKDVSIVQIPSYIASYITVSMTPDAVLEGIKKAILEKDDLRAYTYTITARKQGENVLFNYDVDVWTHKGDVTNRTYEKLDLVDNLDGGYFKIPVKEWQNLFYR